jgi:hypothetical protein
MGDLLQDSDYKENPCLGWSWNAHKSGDIELKQDFKGWWDFFQVEIKVTL